MINVFRKPIRVLNRSELPISIIGDYEDRSTALRSSGEYGYLNVISEGVINDTSHVGSVKPPHLTRVP